MAGLQAKLKGPNRAPIEKLGKNGLRRTHYTQATLATLSRFVKYYGEACDVALATGVSMLPMELLFEELPHNFGYQEKH